MLFVNKDQGRNNVVEEISEVQEKTENDCEQRTTEYVESDRNELSKAVTTELMPDECRSRQVLSLENIGTGWNFDVMRLSPRLSLLLIPA